MLEKTTAIDQVVRAIPTYYSGIKFRSRLEASYAMAFDEFKIRWAYEPEGYNIDKTNYLPDFWMPDIKTFFEVKGPMIPGLSKAKKLYAYFNRYQEDGLWWNPEYMVAWGDELGRMRSIADGDTVLVGLCGVCGEHWLYSSGGYYACRACWFYDGGHHILQSFHEINLKPAGIGK